jgi:organic hydroperoxide reductase OsmC/OhrA
MGPVHTYETTVRWTGNRGQGTSGYRDYDRTHEVSAAGPGVLLGSADRAFRGDADRWNPELLLVSALSQCHLLSYLHLAADHGIVVTAYTDRAVGTMREHDGTGEMTVVVLHPVVEVADPAMVAPAVALHDRAEEVCFIARSVNFPVRHEPAVSAAVAPRDGDGEGL